MIFTLSLYKLSKLTRYFLFLLILVFIFVISSSHTFASENFDTSYSIIYDIDENETTRVILNIGLTNKTTDFFSSSFEVQTGISDLTNILVSDSTGSLNYKTIKNENGIQIAFDFNDKTVGLGNTQEFTISFDTKEIARNLGTVWEINIPGIANQESFRTFEVEVKVPEEFSNPTIIKPKVKILKENGNSLYFTKKELGKAGISLAYGDYQTYQFNLKYHIRNRNIIPELTEIAIPSDNSYQKIAIDDITPRPENVVIDSDGNWLARYKLLPSQDINVVVKGRARISTLPKNENLSNQKRNLYLKHKQFWEVNHSKIQNLANELKSPESIYNYVVNNLSYDPKRFSKNQDRAGAKKVLENPESAVGLEFTDLFIALSRAAGIPARAVEGYVNTSNSADRPLSLVETEDILHTWPEYYDDKKNSWIMVDPTWGNTSKGIDYFNDLDFDHLAFVIKGEESDYPIPAGGYKLTSNPKQKDISVITIESFNIDNPKLTVTTDFPKNFYGGLPMTGNLIVINDSDILSPSLSFKVDTKDLNPNTQNLHIDEIPPYGKKIIPIKFNRANLLTNQSYEVKISIGQDELIKEVTILPIFRNIYFAYFLGGVLAGIFILIISFVIYRSRRLHFPK